MKKLSYQGASKILLNIVNAINDLIDGGGGSSGVQSVTVNQIQSTGKKIATITVDNQSTDLYAPNNSVGSGHIIVDGNNVQYTSRKKLKFWGNVEVADNSQDDATTVRITGVSQTELSTAVNTLQTNFQGGVDAIYNACVSKGSTPASHSLADVVAGILAIPQGGGGGEVVLAGIAETIPKQTKGGIGISDIATFL